MNSTSTSSANPPRPWRWQISLRMLLLVTLLVGVGLTIYRWPWVTKTDDLIFEVDGEEDNVPYVLTTTFHRGWNGAPLRHGVQQILRKGVLVGEAHFYDGLLHGRSRRFDHEGRLLTEVHYVENLLHGPFRLGDGEPTAGRPFIWEGNYARDLPHGEWRVIAARNSYSLTPPPASAQFRGDEHLPSGVRISHQRVADDDYVVRVQNWQQGKREGDWRTETLRGEVINTAKYHDNNLYEWNGQRVVGQFWKWFEKAPLNRETRAMIEASRSYPLQQSLAGKAELRFTEQRSNHFNMPLVIYVDAHPLANFRLPPERNQLVPALCELACENGYAFDCRYGTLWLTPHAADPAPAFVDRTGILAIKFDEGSQQASGWTAEIPVYEDPNMVSVVVDKLLEGSAIRSERNLVIKNLILNLSKMQNATPQQVFCLPRRDAIGLVLYKSGYVCQQRGDQLLLRYPNDEPNGAMFVRPLKSPYGQ